MVFETNHPDRLSSTIERMIYFRGLLPKSHIERLVPTQSLFLVIELDGMTRQIFDNSNFSVLQELRCGWISGIQKHHMNISAHADSEMLAIQFRPVGASQFLPLPLSDFEDRVTPAFDVFGNDFLDLRTQLLSPSSPEEKFQIAAEWLSSRMRIQNTSEETLKAITEAIQNSLSAKISSFAKRYPNSNRLFIADFKKFVGTTPKFFQRIARFTSILTSIENERKVEWSELAYKWGYADQAHLVREFFFFSGFVPTEFTGRQFQNDGTNFFPLVKNIQDSQQLLE
jgi:AraC-like DNA-binding protein